LIKTLVSSMMALIWSAVLLGLLIVVSGILMAQLVATFIVNGDRPLQDRLWAYKYYGTASRATWTMFEATLSGGWPNYARPLIEDVAPTFIAFWLFYVVFVVFAVIRVITALFLHSTLVAAADDEEMMVMNKMKEKEKLVTKLTHFFNEVDTSGDGRLDQDEFDEILEDPRMRAWLQVLELEVYEVSALFNLLVDETGSISCEEFIGGAMRLKGNARAVDSITIMHEQHLIKHSIAKQSHGLHFLWNHMKFDSQHNPWPGPVKRKVVENEVTGVRIIIVGARALRKADLHGHSDPYCECVIPNKKKMKCKTPVMHNQENPVWNFTHEFTDFDPGDSLVFNVWDIDVSGDDHLGDASLQYSQFSPDGFSGELELADPKLKAGKKAFLIVKIEMMHLHDVKKGFSGFNNPVPDA